MYVPIQPGMDKVKPMPAEMVKSGQGRLNLRHSCLADKSQIAKAAYVGIDTLDKVACYKVAITAKDGKNQTAYFDKSNYYLVRTDIKEKTMEDEEEKEISITYSNFKKQPEGIIIPLTESNPIMGGDLTYTSVEINKPVADDVFKPKDSKQTK
jgi:outer membrane lipoprotein-sorting protein